MGFALVDTYSGDDWGGYPWLMMFFAPATGARSCWSICAVRSAAAPGGLAR